MLKEYLAIEIDEDGNLLTLPQILDDYIPQLKYLPLFILWLCTDVRFFNLLSFIVNVLFIVVLLGGVGI